MSSARLRRRTFSRRLAGASLIVLAATLPPKAQAQARGADHGRGPAWLRLAQPASVLVVTEVDQGLQHGSVIKCLVVEEPVRFDVALDAAERNGVTLSSPPLTVASHVIRGAP